MATIAALCVWVVPILKKRLWMAHVLTERTLQLQLQLQLSFLARERVTSAAPMLVLLQIHKAAIASTEGDMRAMFPLGQSTAPHSYHTRCAWWSSWMSLIAQLGLPHSKGVRSN